jgi:hypothetical protein
VVLGLAAFDAIPAAVTSAQVEHHDPLLFSVDGAAQGIDLVGSEDAVEDPAAQRRPKTDCPNREQKLAAIDTHRFGHGCACSEERVWGRLCHPPHPLWLTNKRLFLFYETVDRMPLRTRVIGHI